jgi:hypothetical protein
MSTYVVGQALIAAGVVCAHRAAIDARPVATV